MGVNSTSRETLDSSVLPGCRELVCVSAYTMLRGLEYAVTWNMSWALGQACSRTWGSPVNLGYANQRGFPEAMGWPGMSDFGLCPNLLRFPGGHGIVVRGA